MADLDKALDDFVKAVVGQRRRTHAGIVMMAGAIFDSQLETALTRSMRPLSKLLQRRVFDSFGPLSTFSNKVVMAYALGIVPAGIYQRLEHLRKLRNAFAHSPSGLHFGSPEIMPLLQNLLGSVSNTQGAESAFVEAIKPIEVALQDYMSRPKDLDRG